MNCWICRYAETPGESWEDPQCVEAIRRARENIGDLKLKSDEDYVMPKNLRMNAEQKRAQLISLETKVYSHILLLLHKLLILYSSSSYRENILQSISISQSIITIVIPPEIHCSDSKTLKPQYTDLVIVINRNSFQFESCLYYLYTRVLFIQISFRLDSVSLNIVAKSRQLLV